MNTWTFATLDELYSALSTGQYEPTDNDITSLPVFGGAAVDGAWSWDSDRVLHHDSDRTETRGWYLEERDSA